MRLFLFALLAVILVVPASTALADGYVVLEPDELDRFRPVVIDGTSSFNAADIDSFTSAALSRDGSRLAFSGLLGDESLGLYAIFTVGVDGSNLVQVTSGSYGEFDPAWSPDGSYLVFSQNVSGSIVAQNCCRLARVELATGAINVLTDSNGTMRPSYSPGGGLIAFDNYSGVFTMPSGGGNTTLRAVGGYDASFSPDGSSLVFLTTVGTTTSIQTVKLSTGEVKTVYSTTRTIEDPLWRGGRIHFLEFSGVGYEGRSDVQLRSVRLANSAFRIESSLDTRSVGYSLFNNDEMFFYRSSGEFEFNPIGITGESNAPILEGDEYTTGWDAITAVDLDGDGQDEMFFYRDDGLFRFYHVKADGSLPKPLLEGEGYTTGWDAITAVDLDGDGQDEMFFYRRDGLFRFYHVKADGTLPEALFAGDDFQRGWNSLSAIQLDPIPN